MGWIKHDNLTRHYELRLRKRGRTESLDFETKEEAIAYIAHQNELKSIEREFIAKDLEAELRDDRLLQLAEQFIDETLICRGMIKRKGVFQFTNRVNNPLTDEEKSRIRRVKAKTITVHLPPNWPNQSFPEPCSLSLELCQIK